MFRGAGAGVVSAALDAQLAQGAQALGLALDAPVRAQLLAYLDELGKWNSAYNLTAIRTPSEMVTRHLLDSLAVLPLVAAQAAAGARILDVGSGGGMPGIVLAIARPDWQLTLLDSNGKKARFLRHLARTLRLANVEVAETRVEAWTPPAPYALITSRAFASLADFVTLTRPLLAPGGVWVAMKGKLDEAELAAAAATVEIREIRALSVPGLREDRHAVVAGHKP